MDGLRYKPRTTGNTNGTITKYEIQVSNDGETFTTVASGEWAGDRSWKVAEFDAQTVKFVRLVAVDAITDNQYVFASAAEIRLVGVKAEIHEHSFSDWVVVAEPCCIMGGVEERYCDCGVIEARAIDALGHDYVAEFIEPTCTKSGYTLYTCSRCGDTYKDDPVEPEHKWGEGTVTAPTCTEQGYTTYTCQVCGVKYVDEASWVPAAGHTAGEAVKENEVAPTCTAAGSYDSVVYCSVCNVELSRETVTVAALDHTAGEAVKENEVAPTCTEAGSYESVVYCSVCNVELSRETVAVDALGHDYVAEFIEPTCTKSGYTLYTCTRCGKTYKDDPVEPEHKFGEGVVTAPTCTEMGYTTYTCLVCGAKYVDEASWVPANGHDYVNGDCRNCDATLESVFTDVPAGAFYFDPVAWAVEEGITTGATATTFNPNGTCQRAVVVTFLWRAAGCPSPTSSKNPFTDVKPTDFFYEAVLWAVEQGITNGTSANEFSPYKECNRAQVVTFLWRSQGSPASNAEVAFTDVVPGQFYAAAVAWAVEKGITNGMGDGTFGINSICNRAQVVTFLYRTLA